MRVLFYISLEIIVILPGNCGMKHSRNNKVIYKKMEFKHAFVCIEMGLGMLSFEIAGEKFARWLKKI